MPSTAGTKMLSHSASPSYSARAWPTARCRRRGSPSCRSRQLQKAARCNSTVGPSGTSNTQAPQQSRQELGPSKASSSVHVVVGVGFPARTVCKAKACLRLHLQSDPPRIRGASLRAHVWRHCFSQPWSHGCASSGLRLLSIDLHCPSCSTKKDLSIVSTILNVFIFLM